MSTRTVHVWPMKGARGWSTWSSVSVNIENSSPGLAPCVPWRRITNANRTQAAGSSRTARLRKKGRSRGRGRPSTNAATKGADTRKPDSMKNR